MISYLSVWASKRKLDVFRTARYGKVSEMDVVVVAACSVAAGRIGEKKRSRHFWNESNDNGASMKELPLVHSSAGVSWIYFTQQFTG